MDVPSTLRPLLRLWVLLAAAGFFSLAESADLAPERPDRQERISVLEQGHPRVDACIFGGGAALVTVADTGRSRGAGRKSSAEPVGDLPRLLSSCCPAPSPNGEAAPLAPGEHAPGHYFLRVNGSANANGARA